MMNTREKKGFDCVKSTRETRDRRGHNGRDSSNPLLRRVVKPTRTRQAIRADILALEQETEGRLTEIPADGFVRP